MRLIYKKNDLYLFIILVSMIFPSISLFGFEMPFAYLHSLVGFLVVMHVLFGQIRIPTFAKKLFTICFFIIIQMIISTYLSTISRFGEFIFPTDVVQYVVRFIFLFTFMAFTYSGQIKPQKFIKYFLYILIIAMTIGILQWIPWPGRVFFIKLYPFRDGSLQLSQLNRSLITLRLHGFAQHATANGGIATLSFVFAYTIRHYFDKHKKATLLLMVLSLINIIASQARAGMLALVSSLFFFYIVSMKYNRRRSYNLYLVDRKRSQITFRLIVSITAVVLVISILYYANNRLVVRIINRWLILLKTAGGARLNTQPQYFFSMMNTMDYFMGLSKPIINASAITHGVEVEPINIFVTFGAIGFILQYSLVAILLRYFYERINEVGNDKASLSLLIASFVGLFSYQVFSVGFYFFREIRVGLFPWVLMGVTIGYYARLNKYRLGSRISKFHSD